MKPHFLRWVVILVAMSFGSSLWAASCTITPKGLAFSSYDPTSSTDVTGTGNTVINCSATTFGDLLAGFNVTISLSQGSSGTYTTRTLKQGGQNLDYNLYLNPSGTGTVFGDGSAGTGNYAVCYPGLFASCSGNAGQSGQDYSVPVYGRLPAGQDVGGGSYSDTLIATVTF
jgi:spore coat protein U-like protein